MYLGRDSNGRVRHQHVTFKGSRRQAERELARLVANHDAKPAAVPEEPTRFGPTFTVNDAIAAWRDNGWADLSPKTTRGYESTWRVHIEEAIGKRRIASLTTYDVEHFYRSLKAAGQGPATTGQVKARSPSLTPSGAQVERGNASEPGRGRRAPQLGPGRATP